MGRRAGHLGKPGRPNLLAVSFAAAFSGHYHIVMPNNPKLRHHRVHRLDRVHPAIAAELMVSTALYLPSGNESTLECPSGSQRAYPIARAAGVQRTVPM